MRARLKRCSGFYREVTLACHVRGTSFISPEYALTVLKAGGTNEFCSCLRG